MIQNNEIQKGLETDSLYYVEGQETSYGKHVFENDLLRSEAQTIAG